MVSQGPMQERGGGFWRWGATVLCIGFLAALLFLMAGRSEEIRDALFPPPLPTPIPREPHARSQLAADLTAMPSADALQTLWKLVRDDHHFVRGQALEALATAGEGARMDPRRAETVREIAADDTDWNRRSACVMLVQRDPRAALPLVAELYARTTNENTRRALIEALRARGEDAQRVLVQEAGRREGDPVGEFARRALRELDPRK